MKKCWTDSGWNDYMSWHQSGDKRLIKKINQLIKDIDRHPYTGIGKPERLKFELSGKWSRRIDSEHRLIYRVEADQLFIYSARDHY